MMYVSTTAVQRRISLTTTMKRLSAEDLLKSKYMKAIIKSPPVTILKDLIVRYEGWMQSGGTRASVAGSLPWEEEESRQ
jgi:serine/threonine-protein kinase 24/25/MST4